MPFAIENPMALLLLLALPGIYFLGRGRLSLMSPWRARAILAARLASMAAIILGLSGLSMPLNNAGMSVTFAMDVSASVSPATRAQEEQWVRQAIGQMRPTDRAAVVTFSGDSQVARPLGNGKDLKLPPAPKAGGTTDLAAALKQASGLLPASGLRKVVLLTDGWDTGGGLQETVRSLPAGTRLDVVRVPAMEGQPEVLVESMDLPPYIREGDGFDVSAVVGSNHEGTAQLRVLVDGKETSNWPVQLGAGANLVTMSQKALPLGFHSVEVQLSTPGDTVEDNNSATGFVVVKPKGQVLLVEGNSGGSGYLRQELEGSGLQVDRILVSELPREVPDLHKYDAVVLNDVSGPSLSLDQMKALQSYTRDEGKGLVVVGGRNSYGLGDYGGGPLEDILPVSSNVPPTRERGDLALILVIDKSGSMDDSSGGVSKVAMAREAALQATETLRSGDQIGVIAFDTEPEWIVPLETVGNNLPNIRSRVSSLQASGGTDIFTALQSAYASLRGIQATTKHITLLTDGQSWKGQYQELIAKMRNEKITLSTIGIGEDADTSWLSEMARLGQGRFYFTQQFTDIPKIVYREVTAATKIAQVDGQVEPVFVTPSPILRGMNGDGMPPLTGYVATEPKDAATVILRSSRGDPLLSQWQFGLGRVVAWTSDAEGLWSANWISQPEYSRIWDQAVRWAMAPPVDRSLQVSAQVDGQQATVTVDSVDRANQFINLADTGAVVSYPDGHRVEYRLRQTAPGRYEATIPAPNPGLYRVDVHQVRADRTAGSETAAFSMPAAPEFAGLGSNDALLKELASMTGGQALHDPPEAFSRQGMPSTAGWEPLWPYLLAVSLLLLPVEVALRRLRTIPFTRQPEDDEPDQPAPEEQEPAAPASTGQAA